MNLSKINLPSILLPDSSKLRSEIFDLPEKVLQFGTGVLLRALPDYFIDKANRQGVFNGRVLVVKSTTTGDADAFDRQDGMYTLLIRGLENGNSVDQAIINSSISRVLSATHSWDEILKAAANPELHIAISNTTEVGLNLVRESVFKKPPVSFPAKLLAFLFERFKIFQGLPEAGMVIIPTELLTDNGEKLKTVIIELADFNKLEFPFIEWLDKHNRFCNSLVDRIVPGKPDYTTKEKLEKEWGYEDDLMAVCEPYRLWAIEGDESIKRVLSFYSVDDGVVITPDITKFKELKLRMLNATHTLSCGLAFLACFETVRGAMENPDFSFYIWHLMMEEIGGAIPIALPETEIREFGTKVFDRLRNSFLRHQWLSMTVQYSTKMAMRVVPVLKRYYEIYKKAPELISTGFASFILFMRPVKKEFDKYYGILNNEYYLIQDDWAIYFFSLWQKVFLDDLVHTLLANEELWQYDLTSLQGFGDMVTKKLKLMINSGSLQVLEERK